MNNPLWKMMINNAQAHLRDKTIPEEQKISAFQMSEVLAVLTGKLPADIVIEIGGFSIDKIAKEANDKFGSTMKKLNDK